jgi:hypothetical protein
MDRVTSLSLTSSQGTQILGRAHETARKVENKPGLPGPIYLIEQYRLRQSSGSHQGPSEVQHNKWPNRLNSPKEEIERRLNSATIRPRVFCLPVCCKKIYKTIILPVVLYGCKTWSLTLREEHRLRVFENRVPRRIFGPKRDEVTGGWKKLHNEELRDLYPSQSIIRIIKARRMRWAGYVARMGE